MDNFKIITDNLSYLSAVWMNFVECARAMILVNTLMAWRVIKLLDVTTLCFPYMVERILSIV